LIVVWWWYFHWNVHLAEEFGQWYNSGKALSEGAVELTQHLGAVLERFYFSAYHSFVWGIVSLVGFIFLIYKRSRVVGLSSAILLPLIVLYMMKSGSLFSHHGYYALILVPWLAVCGALFLAKINARIAVTILVVGFIESVANQQHDFFIKPGAFRKLQLESIANDVSQPSDLVALVSNANPNEFYFLNRKGWLVDPTQCNASHLQDITKRGCRFLFVPRERLPIEIPYSIAFDYEHYVVYQLK
jgi:hypothetical protein